MMKKGLWGSELKRARLAAALTQEQLSLRSKLDTATIDAIEAGVVEPGLEELFRLALALGIEADELVKTVWQKNLDSSDH
ncbi:helix-turn-helix domain-containing protein [Exilibacterium tricleocarpae]|nr:helix-turn-helix transcriptional regulator [Exilibacterium tricleocarpae]